MTLEDLISQMVSDMLRIEITKAISSKTIKEKVYHLVSERVCDVFVKELEKVISENTELENTVRKATQDAFKKSSDEIIGMAKKVENKR